VLIVGWMIMTVVLSTWPSVAYSINSTIGEWVARTQGDRTLKPLDTEEQRERWSDPGSNGDPRGLTPFEQWKGLRPLNPPTEERHRARGYRATQPTLTVPTPTNVP
jgi:hypothetical protein